MAGVRRLVRRTPDEAPDFDFGGDDDAVAVAQANAEALDAEGEWFVMTPQALALEPLFEQAVAALADEDTPVSEVIGLARHPDGWVASMALAALERREDVPEAWADAAIRGLPRPSNCEDALQLRAIARHASGPVIGRVLGRYEGINAEYVVDFVRRRLDGGETVTAETFEGNVTAGQAEDVASVPRSIRYGHGRRGSGCIRRVAHARALRLDRAHLAAAVRPAPHSPHRQTERARRPDRGVPHRHAAPLRAARRRARRREDGTRPGGARPGRGRDRVRGDRVPDPRRPGVRRRAGLAREAARRRDARPERGLVAAGAAGGPLRRPASPQSAGTSRRAPPARRIGHDDTGRRGHANGARCAPRCAAARDVGLRRDPGGSPRPGGFDRRRTACARARRPRRRDRRPDPHPVVRPRPTVPARRGVAGRPAPAHPLHGRRRARGRPGQLRRRRRARNPCGRLGAPARTPRRLGGASAGGRSRVLRAAHPAAAGCRDLHGRADRDDQGGPDRPDAAARRPPVPRTDRDGQDGDREDAGRVPLRLARPSRASRHERVPDPGVARAAPLGVDARAAGCGADLRRTARSVQRCPPRRVREGRGAGLGRLPAGVRRREADGRARTAGGLPPLRDRADLERRLGYRGGSRRRLRAERGRLQRDGSRACARGRRSGRSS